MIRALSSKISSQRIFDIQANQYTDTLYIEDTVPALQTKPGRVAVSNLGHFLCKFITGSYESLFQIADEAQPPVNHIIDPGACFLKAQLSDQLGNRRLFSDYIPLDLWLSPGRRKSMSAENVQADATISGYGADDKALKSDPAYGLFYPVEFEYLFGANSEILLDVKNDSNVACAYSIAFHGIRIISGTVSK